MKIINYFILVSIIFISSTYATPLGGGPIGGGSAVGGSGDITQVGTCTTGACTTDFIDETAIDLTSLTLDSLTFDVGSVSKTEFGYLNGVTSGIQAQINALAGGGGAPTDATYWTGSTNSTLSGEIVVNSAASLENAANLGAFFSDYADDADATTMRATLGLIIGTNVLAPNGNGSSLINVDAATGDSATAFFDDGTIEHERGGLEANVSGYTGIIGITGGSTAEVDTPVELETYAGLGAYASDILTCANLQALIALLQAGDWTFGAASDIDMSGANSVTMGPLQLGANADFGDYDVTSVDKLEGVDSGTYIDMGASGIVEVGGGLQAKPRYQTDASGAITIIINAVNYGTDTGDADIPDGACDAAGDVGNWVVLISDTADQYSLTSDDASNLFILDDNTSLDAGDELDVDGTMVSVMCVAAETWKVVGYIDTAPTDGGPAD